MPEQPTPRETAQGSPSVGPQRPPVAPQRQYGVPPRPPGVPPPAPRRRGLFGLSGPRLGLLAALALLVVVVGAQLVGGGRPNPDGSNLTDTPSPSIGATSPAARSSSSPAVPTSGPTATPPPTATPSPPPPRKVAPPTSVPPTELTGYVWPLRRALITSRFGPRDFGGFVIIDGEEVHDGLDLATGCGGRIRAAHDGTVLYAGRNFDRYLGYWGRADRIYARHEQRGTIRALPIVIVIDDGNGYRSVYVHLNKAQVEAGDVVKAGEVIGVEGSTGFSTGCHLHYALIRMDGPWQPVVSNLHQFGYPPMVRQRINPIRIFAWDDQYAPQSLRDRVEPSAAPSSPPGPVASPSGSPPTSPAASPSGSPSTSPGASPSPTASSSG